MSRRTHPGGYSRENRSKGKCSACGEKPIAKGKRFLCNKCFTDTWGYDKVEPEIITREEAIELCVRVEQKLLAPPTPVKHLSCNDYTQEELQAYLDGGGT